MDGGYYAIKGFEFQIDKNIFEILNEPDSNKQINIEQTQDIDSEDFVMQVKYKEATKFVPSAIKDPVIQLIKEYRNNPNRKYILYCFFNDWNGYDSDIDIDDILGKSKIDFTKVEKEGFQKKFELQKAVQFELQLENTIKKISDLGYDEENAIIHHSRLTQHLRNLVINNDPANSANRFTTKDECIKLIKADRKIIFTSAYREYKGDQAFIVKCKKDFFTFRNLDKHFRIVVIELNGTETISQLKHTSITIKNKFYKFIYSDIKGEAPFIYFKNISNENLVALKTELINEGNVLKDGFDFENAAFNERTVITKSSKLNRISLRFINKEEYLEPIINGIKDTTKEVYQFYISEPLNINHSNKEVKIEIKSLNDIIQILN